MSPKRKLSKAGKSAREIKIQSLLRHDDLPATVGLVKEVRAELVAKIDSLDHRIDSLDHRIGSLDHRIGSLDHRIGSLDHRIDSLDHKIDSVEHKVLSAIHRTQTLMEEQRGENKIVLDGIKSVMERQDRMDGEAKEFRETLQVLVKAKDRTSN